jgi:Ankyrin repeats (3 copies)
MKGIVNLPPEIRCKIYKHCDTESLFNFGNTHPKYMSEIIRCCDKIKLWFRALIEEHTDWMKALIKSGIDINIRDNNGETALMGAICLGNIPLLKMLIKMGAKLDVRSYFGDTALHQAVYGDQHSMVCILMKAGANPHIRNNNNRTVIDIVERMYNEYGDTRMRNAVLFTKKSR